MGKVTKKDVEEKEQVSKVVRRVTGTPEPKGKVATLPLVSSLFTSTEEMQQAISHLETAMARKSEIDRLTKDLDAAKEEMIGIAVGAEVAGYRYGELAVLVDTQTRTSLNKDRLRSLLIDAGVDPVIVGRAIQAAYTEGDPFYVVKIQRV